MTVWIFAPAISHRPSDATKISILIKLHVMHVIHMISFLGSLQVSNKAKECLFKFYGLKWWAWLEILSPREVLRYLNISNLFKLFSILNLRLRQFIKVSLKVSFLWINKTKPPRIQSSCFHLICIFRKLKIRVFNLFAKCLHCSLTLPSKVESSEGEL